MDSEEEAVGGSRVKGEGVGSLKFPTWARTQRSKKKKKKKKADALNEAVKGVPSLTSTNSNHTQLSNTS